MSLGFAAGVMTAASYWSLLEPAISMCKSSSNYGSEGQYAFLPVAFGFLFGAVFVFGTDKFLDYLGINSTNMMISKYIFLTLFIFYGISFNKKCIYWKPFQNLQFFSQIELLCLVFIFLVLLVWDIRKNSKLVEYDEVAIVCTYTYMHN